MRDEGEDVYTAWRLAYDLAPTDPRWLDATEEVILRDLLVRRYHDEHMRRLLNPGETAVEEMARDPRTADRLEALKRRTMSDPGVLRALHALGIGGKQKEAAPPGPGKLRVVMQPGSSPNPRKVKP